MEITLAIVFTLVAIIATIIAWRISASINRPLMLIRDAIVKVDSTRDLSLRIDYDGKDEIGDVARSTNQMLQGFQAVVYSVNDSVLHMNQQTQQLSQTAERTASDAEDAVDVAVSKVALT